MKRLRDESKLQEEYFGARVLLWWLLKSTLHPMPLDPPVPPRSLFVSYPVMCLPLLITFSESYSALCLPPSVTILITFSLNPPLYVLLPMIATLLLHLRGTLCIYLQTSAKVTLAFSWISWLTMHEIHIMHEIQTEEFTSTLCIRMDYDQTKSKPLDYNLA